jgi:hypothetical protein
MPNKKLPDFPSVTTLQNNDIFLIESAATTSTVSYGTLSSSIINNTPRVNSVAIGTIAYIAATTPPAGYLECNGSAVSVSVYTDLTNAIYCGDGNNATASFGYRCTDSASPSTSRSTTGNFIVLPDLRGEFIRGWDNGRGIDAGRVFGSWQKGTLMGYDLEEDAVFNVSSKSKTINGPATQPIIGVDDYNISDYPEVKITGATSTGERELKGGSSGAGSGGYSGTTRPRNVALLPCIYAFNANLTQTAIDVVSLLNFFNSEINKINARGTLTSGTAITLTGTSNVDFNNIPSWVKKITIMVSEMSTNGAYSSRLQVGTSAGFITTGYRGSKAGIIDNSTTASYTTDGFAFNDNDAVDAMPHNGSGTLTKMSDTIWCYSGVYGLNAHQTRVGLCGGAITITGTLDRIRFTTSSSSGTFDGGTVNIMWE